MYSYRERPTHMYINIYRERETWHLRTASGTSFLSGSSIPQAANIYIYIYVYICIQYETYTCIDIEKDP